ncbi:hypothetical protein ES288_D05G368800v1 [Gossypium darwinii]|uniref:Endonuclease/exonuclease/phosphatase domain-containing protein n=1 Tax=Gossypium darwinii TaxID=34276 RepID=A0A5D2CNL7_GOSDA|nr:hypothetical protein ES288_D05G368800v1 [Gossypium darwinii]
MKIFCWNCRGVGNPATVRELKQLLVANVPDIVFLSETKIHANDLSYIRTLCRMEGCVGVSSDRKSGGLALMWREGMDVAVQNYSRHHIDSVVCMENGEKVRFTGFYGHTEPRLRNEAWEMLRRVKGTVTEGWIVEGDFNAILNDSEKEGGHKEPRAMMEDFREILEELSLMNVKTFNGWFTWSNNRDGNGLVKERLDRFVISDDIVEKCLFLPPLLCASLSLTMKLSLWTCTGIGRERKDTTLRFGLGMIVVGLRSGKLKTLFLAFGLRQYNRYRRMRYKVKSLEKDIGRLMDGPMNERATKLIKEARYELGQLYDAEEKYWATRSRAQWLREGDKNTRFFHVRASGRRKKNSINRLKDEQGNWHEDKEGICRVA